MTDKKDFIDISPEEGGSKGKKSTVFQETEWRVILDNPNRLTKEGAEKKLELWKRSNNKHVQIFYETMLARCKNFAPSGKTTDGGVILNREANGDPKWVEALVQPLHTEVKPKAPVKEEGKEKKKVS